MSPSNGLAVAFPGGLVSITSSAGFPVSTETGASIEGGRSGESSIGGMSCASCRRSVFINCHCFSDFKGRISCPFNCNLSCAAFRCIGPSIGISGNVCAISVSIGGINGFTKGRIIRLCISTPGDFRVGGPRGRLGTFAGAGRLEPNRAIATALGLGAASLTSCSRTSSS